jgi:hypothetical protein
MLIGERGKGAGMTPSRGVEEACVGQKGVVVVGGADEHFGVCESSCRTLVRNTKSIGPEDINSYCRSVLAMRNKGISEHCCFLTGLARLASGQY